MDFEVDMQFRCKNKFKQYVLKVVLFKYEGTSNSHPSCSFI